ncbi:MAG: 23S rRNA (guanosine(2251)-2'-O)-methyltransferase RlmB [Bacteroidetes bacterium]|nr:MAG: 23S rRNA (guanosine(2251)-2'-O)-methyltransferase RlmB [Bacteroidota bacterium]
MVYGIRPVLEALDAGHEVEKAFVQRGAGSEAFRVLLQKFKTCDVPYQVVPVEKLNRLTRKNHQGVVAYISPVAFSNIEHIVPGLYEQGKMPFLLMLDRISDVRNFGALLRTAESAGVDAVVIPSKGSAQLNSGTIKSSAGAIYKIPICRAHNLKEVIDFLKSSGIKVAAATEKTSQPYFKTDLTGPVAIIMGSEGEGVSGEYLKRADVKLKIPMLGEIESLNVSVAGGVLMYEVVRQRLNEV